MGRGLDRDVVETELKSLSGWSFADDAITKEFVRKDFRDAVSFIVRLSYEAEAMNHHPELQNVYNKVRVVLTTHDAGNKVTEKDLELASAIESISESWN